MTISWGYKITAVYVVFVAGILFLAFKANQQKFDLVTEDYYGEELKYQNVIDQKSNVSALSAAPAIRHSVDQLNIQFPQEFQGKSMTGEMYLYRPSDASKDIRKTFAVNGPDLQVALPAALSGSYIIKLSWQVNGKSFYNEQKIVF